VIKKSVPIDLSAYKSTNLLKLNCAIFLPMKDGSK